MMAVKIADFANFTTKRDHVNTVPTAFPQTWGRTQE